VRKIYTFKVEGRHPDRVLDAIKHDIRKYLKRERRRVLPPEADFWDFNCRFGLDKDSAQMVLVSALIAQLDAAARGGAEQAYVEILAMAARKAPRPAAEPAPYDGALTDAEGVVDAD
jgi:hypothetical protein